MRDKLTKFNKLNFSEKLIIFESSLVLLTVRFLTKFIGFKMSHKILNRIPLIHLKPKNEKLFIAKAEKFIKSTSTTLPVKTSCVEESISLWLMLRTRKINSYLKIGVNNQGEDKLNAHAWVEIDGYVVSGTKSINKPFSGFEHRFFYENK